MKTVLLIFLSLVCISVVGQNQLSIESTRQVQKVLNEYHIGKDPGIAVSVAQDGHMLYKSNRGYANLEHMIPISDSTRFLVGSISKQFTAFSILLLHHDGLLGLDDDIVTYLPELSALPHVVTIRHFLHHTSGFRDNTDLNSLKGTSDLNLTSHSDMVDLLLRQKGLNFRPGDRFQYSNSGYVLLAEIVERVSGISFADFTQQRIFVPLGMTESLFVDDIGLVVKNKASSYSRSSNQYSCFPMNRSVVGATGLFTSVNDLSLWADNFTNATVGNEIVFELMSRRGILNSGVVLPYAAGQELKRYKGVDVVFHGGGDAAYRSYLLRVPEHKLSIIISGNFEAFNPLNMAYGLLDVFLAAEIEEPAASTIPVYSNEELSDFTGDYQLFPGLYITIEASGDTLYFKGYGSDDRIVLPVMGAKTFKFAPRAQSRIVFGDGDLTWHFSDFYYPAKKVDLTPPAYADLNVPDFLGWYTSSEVQTTYEVVVREGKLFLEHNYNPEVELRPIAEDSFITDASHTGRIVFIRSEDGKINGCKISGQASYDVMFSKGR